MDVKKISLLINPRNGENVTKLADILAVLSAAGWKPSIALKEYRRHIMQLANEAATANSDLIVAYGGDGAFNQVVNGVISAKNSKSIVGLIPGGTANMWAAEVGIPNDPVQAALALVNSQERKVDVGCFDVQAITFPGEAKKVLQKKIQKKAKKKSSKTRHHFLLWAGLGIDAAIMGNVSKPLKYRIGSLAVGVSALKELPAQQPYPVQIYAIQGKGEEELVWKGEARQVVISNSRRYAKVTKMAPEAYVDDGLFDICVITVGDPLSTLEQVTSLLLRKHPDETSAEYFRGACFRITMPATVPFQLDGSAIKLKDYLSSADYERLVQSGDQSQVMVTYQCNVLPQVLNVAVPLTYDEEVFEQQSPYKEAAAHESQAEEEHSIFHLRWPGQQKESDGNKETAAQKHTVAVETCTTTELEGGESHRSSQAPILNDNLPQVLSDIKHQGREVVVVGKVPNPQKTQTYVIAGYSKKASSGEEMPVAVVVDLGTVVYNRHGQRVTDLTVAIQEVAANDHIIVDAKRSKRNVLRAKRLIV